MIKLMELPYSYTSLEPYISRNTVNIHYNRHHQGYVNKLNELLIEAKREEVEDPIWIIKHIDTFPFELRDDILYNAMAINNHDLYWNSINMTKKFPDGELKRKINNKYGNYDNFKKEFERVANTMTGSGYTFLVKDKKGELYIMNMSNQDSPYVYGYIPLLTLDLWEHSYYLDHLNNRHNYIDNFFSIIDFDLANEKYAQAK